MKRYSVETRKRTASNTVEDTCPRGPLTDEELAAARRAYRDGCRGEVIIGMRGEERVIAMLVPETADTTARGRMPAIRAELKQLGCDGCILACRARHATGAR